MSENTFFNSNKSWYPRRPEFTPFLEDILESDQPIPPHSVMLGQCEDDLPLLLDLTDPQAGSFLIASDHGFANTLTLHSILTSAYILNSEDDLIFHLISPFVDDLQDLHQQPNFRIGIQPGRPECEIALEELTNLTHHRRANNEIIPIQILAIDSLDILLTSLSPKSVLHLNWLIEKGPEVGIWVFAALESAYLQKDFTNTLLSFPSKILGQILNSRISRFLSGAGNLYIENLKPGRENIVLSGQNRIKVWMPPLENFNLEFIDE